MRYIKLNVEFLTFSFGANPIGKQASKLILLCLWITIALSTQTRTRQQDIVGLNEGHLLMLGWRWSGQNWVRCGQSTFANFCLRNSLGQVWDFVKVAITSWVLILCPNFLHRIKGLIWHYLIVQRPQKWVKTRVTRNCWNFDFSKFRSATACALLSISRYSPAEIVSRYETFDLVFAWRSSDQNWARYNRI